MLLCLMTYSLDLRERVVSFVETGGSKTEASRLYKVNRNTIYQWLTLDDLRPKPAVRRNRKINRELLRAHVERYPQAILRERAKKFNVSIAAISKSLKSMNIVKKTNGDI